VTVTLKVTVTLQAGNFETGNEPVSFLVKPPLHSTFKTVNLRACLAALAGLRLEAGFPDPPPRPAVNRRAIFAMPAQAGQPPAAAS
jgi:hypothetical protein